jgi:hypothetical protein
MQINQEHAMPAGQAHQEPDRIEDGRRTARRAIEELALRHGAAALTRPPYPGAQSTIRTVEPLAGLRAAREIELGTRHAISNYIRAAREAGQSWHDIGTAMHLVPGRDASIEGDTPAEAAFSYATARPGPESGWRFDRSLSWTCGSCQNPILDHGPYDPPADAERGHADNCPRLQAVMADWDAQWEAGE